MDHTPQLVRWGVQNLLPNLIANADHEGSTDDTVVVEYDDCPPRTLLRVYWPLQLD